MKVPKLAELEAVNVTVWGAAVVTLKGDAGEAISPAGRPEIAIETVPENPFKGVIETCTFVEPSRITVSDCELVWMLKSGVGGGDGAVPLLGLEPQPEESSVSRARAKRKKTSKRAISEELPRVTPWRVKRMHPLVSGQSNNLYHASGKVINSIRKIFE
jgi:hypothetical protein